MQLESGCGKRRRDLTIVAVLVTALCNCTAENKSIDIDSVQIVDSHGPYAPWGKTTGDVNNDGLVDIVVGGHSPAPLSLLRRVLIKLHLSELPVGGDLVWYENPSWSRHDISNKFNVRTDLEVGDINSDSYNDFVVLTDQGVVLMTGPEFKGEVIDTRKFHDVELADINNDERLDLVLRDQSLFGHKQGNEVVLLVQQDDNLWVETILETPHGEGLSVADLNDDGQPEIIVNGNYYEKSGSPFGQQWQARPYTLQWQWQDVVVEVADFNQDGRADIALAPAEPKDARYRVSWFEAPAAAHANWIEHVVERDVEAVRHALQAADADGDGDIDLFSAEMNQGEDPDEVILYLNNKRGDSWTKVILGSTGAHAIRAADTDGDFAAEIIGANWNISNYTGTYNVYLWDHTIEDKLWKKTKLVSPGSRRQLFVRAADFNEDGKPDLAAGAYWHENPGSISAGWARHPVGAAANNAIWVDDFNQDGHIDLLASRWDTRFAQPSLKERVMNKLFGQPYPGTLPGNEFVIATNDGTGQFSIESGLPAVTGDFLQGVAQIDSNGKSLLAFSWHETGFGIHAYDMTSQNDTSLWVAQKLTEFSQDEQLNVADINNDNVPDLVTGTRWLDGANDWHPVTIVDNNSAPDRNIVADMNKDGFMDIVVGYEAISKPGKLAWYQQVAGSNGTIWKEHVIGFPVGPMSLGVADMDGDGNLDVVTGEHNLRHPKSARLILYRNLGDRWQPELLGRGDEHHNGLEILDLDGDGDLDIASIGWSHSNILLYENPAQ